MRTRIVAFAALASLACGGGAPSAEDLDEAKENVNAFLDLASMARAAAELFGLLPQHTCGEARATFVGKVADKLRADIACATVTVEHPDAATDAVVASFPDAGCTWKEHSLKGRMAVRVSGGDERFLVEADLHGTKYDDEPLPVTLGYGVCGDDKSAHLVAEADLPKRPGTHVKLDARVTGEAGVAIFGSTTFVMDGTGEVRTAKGTSSVTMTALAYKPGEYLPKEGTLEIRTASGHVVKATFQSTLWRLGKVKLVVDDHDPVEVPMVH